MGRGLQWKKYRASTRGELLGVQRFYARPPEALCLAHHEGRVPGKFDPGCHECRKRNPATWDPMKAVVLPPRLGQLTMAEWRRKRAERELLIAKADVRRMPDRTRVVVPLSDCDHCRKHLRTRVALTPASKQGAFKCSVCGTRWRRRGKEIVRL